MLYNVHFDRRTTGGLHPYLRQRELTGASIPDLLGSGEDDDTIHDTTRSPLIDHVPNNDPDGANDLGSERLPPLRELIWRRLRRRNAQLSRLDDQIDLHPGGGLRLNRIF